MPLTKNSDAQSLKRDVGVRLRVAVYDALAEKKGLRSVAAAARHHRMQRTSLFDYRSGRKSPRLDIAMKMAADLGTTVEEIFELMPRSEARP